MPSAPQHLRKYPPDSAGRLALAPVPIASLGDTVRTVRERLRTERHACADLVLVVGEDGRYLGAAALTELATKDDTTALDAIVRKGWPKVTPEIDQEYAVEIAAQAAVGTLPVVTAEGSILGCIPATVLLEVLAREHREDLHRLAGIVRERAGARHALEDPPLHRVIRRIPWLLIGLALSVPATAIMAGFERALQTNVAIVFFIPALVYLTDAIGTQTEAIAVRGLSLRRRPFLHLLAGEAATGGLIGLILGLVAFAGVWLAFADHRLATSVGLALFAAGTLASVLGLTLPWALSRLNIDPAFGAGPVATILQDVATILVYFAFAGALLDLNG